MIAVEMTGALARGWVRPSCVAEELALRCLFDQVEVIQDLYDLDLPDGWRSLLEQHMLEDADSEMLYQNAMDGFESDVELNMQLGPASMKIQDWFEPFHDASVTLHQVLQTVFAWEDADLYRFTPDDPFAPLGPVDGEIPEVLQWIPG
jgi:hypothetical protein